MKYFRHEIPVFAIYGKWYCTRANKILYSGKYSREKTFAECYVYYNYYADYSMPEFCGHYRVQYIQGVSSLHSFIPVLLCMCGRRPLPTYLCACAENKLAHVHILPNHVTLSSCKGSQKKTLRIESPPSLWATSTSECHPFAFSRPPCVSVLFSLLILPCRFFEAAHFSTDSVLTC